VTQDPFHDTLRTLKLQNTSIERIPTKHSPIRTLTQFTTLEHFSTFMFAINNIGSRIHKILPKSLIELELSDTSESQSSLESIGDDVNNMLWGLAEAKLERLPNLTRFALTLDEWDHSNLKFERRSINGVEFCFGCRRDCELQAWTMSCSWKISRAALLPLSLTPYTKRATSMYFTRALLLLGKFGNKPCTLGKIHNAIILQLLAK
jgi:hypothetical protein